LIWAACLLTASVPYDATAAAAIAPFAGTACVVYGPDTAKTTIRQDAAAAKSGRIPGLGAVKARIGWDNRRTLTLVDEQFTVTRTFDLVTRGIELSVSGPGEESLTIHYATSQGLQLYTGARRVDLSNANEIAAAVRGRAVQAFRERIGNFERRLIAGAAARPDSPHADGFLFVGAFVASLAGDPTAMGRARDLVLGRIRGRLRAVRFDFKDCVTDYELYLLDIDTQRTQCLEAANSRSTWYLRAADRLGCEAEFMAQALAGEGQFLSCTALGAVVA
jgi:hypothetical protein